MTLREVFSPFIRLKYLYLFFLLLVALYLQCCVQALSSCSKWGLLSGYGTRASHCHGFSCCSAQAPGHMDFSGCSIGVQ